MRLNTVLISAAAWCAAGCTSNPPAPPPPTKAAIMQVPVDPSPSCTTLMFTVVVEQGRQRMDLTGGLRGATVEIGMGSPLSIDLSQPLSITATVTYAAVDCQPFVADQVWTFSGTLAGPVSDGYSGHLSSGGTDVPFTVFPPR